MYGLSEGDIDTPRTDSPVIFVLSDKMKKVHPKVDHYNLYSQPDWRASTKGSVGGRGEYQLEDQINLAARPPHRKRNKAAVCLCDCLLTLINGFLLPCLVLIGPAFLLFLLYNCYSKNNVTVLQVLYHYFPFLESSLKTIHQTYNKTKHSVDKLDLLKVKTGRNFSAHDVRSQASNNSLFPRFQKQIFRPRSLEPTSTTLLPSNVVIDSELTNSTTLSENFAECHVILLPFLVFFSICLMIIYVMCKYKICAKNKDNLGEKEEDER